MKLALVLLLMLLTACKPALETSRVPSMPASSPDVTPQMLTLMQVNEAFSKLPMVDAKVYDETTDTNHLFNRPNGYVEKMNWRDAREKVEKIPPKDDDAREASRDCSIEIFRNESDAQSRKEYIEAVGKAAPIFGKYVFVRRNVVVHLPFKLQPSQADDYKQALESLQ